MQRIGCLQTVNETLRNINKKDVNLCIFGNAIQAGMGQAFDRVLCTDSGIPLTTSSYAINMVCGSGAQAVINICKEIDLGLNLGVAGGYEFMSNIPYATNTYLRLGKKFGNFEMMDLMLRDGLIDLISGEHMGLTAERIAETYHITREDQDVYALRSQKLAIEAIDSNFFKDEIVPIRLKDYRNREFECTTDEFPRRDTDLEKLSRLKITFKANGTLTAGNVSGINDGACFLTIASERYVNKAKLHPLAEIVDYVSIGCDHAMMGLGPYYAIKALLARNKLSITDIAILEINEAFAAQILGDIRLLAEEYGVTEEEIKQKTNIHGSGISLGHPLGCSGARILTTLIHIMKNGYKGKYGIASLCVGGGQGIAILVKGM